MLPLQMSAKIFEFFWRDLLHDQAMIGMTALGWCGAEVNYLGVRVHF